MDLPLTCSDGLFPRRFRVPSSALLAARGDAHHGRRPPALPAPRRELPPERSLLVRVPCTTNTTSGSSAHGRGPVARIRPATGSTSSTSRPCRSSRPITSRRTPHPPRRHRVAGPPPQRVAHVLVLLDLSPPTTPTWRCASWSTPPSCIASEWPKQWRGRPRLRTARAAGRALQRRDAAMACGGTSRSDRPRRADPGAVSSQRYVVLDERHVGDHDVPERKPPSSRWNRAVRRRPETGRGTAGGRGHPAKASCNGCSSDGYGGWRAGSWPDAAQLAGDPGGPEDDAGACCRVAQGNGAGKGSNKGSRRDAKKGSGLEQQRALCAAWRGAIRRPGGRAAGETRTG